MRKRMGGMYDIGRGVQNEKRMNDAIFQRACELAGIPVTRRQAGKWNNRKGAAYSLRSAARKAEREKLQHSDNRPDRHREDVAS